MRRQYTLLSVCLVLCYDNEWCHSNRLAILSVNVRQTAPARIKRFGSEEECLNVDRLCSLTRTEQEYGTTAFLLCVVTVHDDSPFRIVCMHWSPDEHR